MNITPHKLPGFDILKAELMERLRRLTQTELARLAGTTIQHVNDVVAGRRAPNEKLIDYLGFEVRLVTTRKFRPSPPPDDSARQDFQAGV
jgi:transcriptional regulator with XRE-family HTH domain